MSFAPFIDGSYGVAVLFLAGISLLTWRRYGQALRRLKAVENR